MTFEIYKNSLGIGAYDVKNEDGSPIVYEPINMMQPYFKAKRSKEIKPMIGRKQYISGNFRGALSEYIKQNYTGVDLNFETEKHGVDDSPVFTAHCTAIGGEN